MTKKQKKIAPFFVYLEGEKIEITQEMIDESSIEVIKVYRKELWKQVKKEQRSTRCLNPDGTRCNEKNKCALCEKIQRIDIQETCNGLPRSLDEMAENDDPMPSSHTFISPEEYIIKQELSQILYTAINSLEPQDKEIILLFSENKTEEEIASVTKLKQRTVNNHKHKIFEELRKKLKDF